MPERNSSSPTLGRRPKWILFATHHCNDRVHTGYVVSQDFLQMKEKWTRKNNEDVDEQDAREEFAQTETLVWDKIVSWECSGEVLKSFKIDGKVHFRSQSIYHWARGGFRATWLAGNDWQVLFKAKQLKRQNCPSIVQFQNMSLVYWQKYSYFLVLVWYIRKQLFTSES